MRICVMILMCFVSQSAICGGEVNLTFRSGWMASPQTVSDVLIVSGRPYSLITRIKSLPYDPDLFNVEKLDRSKVTTWLKSSVNAPEFSVNWVGKQASSSIKAPQDRYLRCADLKLRLRDILNANSDEHTSYKGQLICDHDLMMAKPISSIEIERFYRNHVASKQELSINVEYTDGTLAHVRRWFRPITIKRTLVARKEILSGSFLQEDDCSIEFRLLKPNEAAPMNFDISLSDFKARYNIDVGSVISGKNIASSNWIEKGSSIPVKYTDNGIEIQVMAKTLEAGEPDDVIAVSIPQSDKPLHVKILPGVSGELFQP